MAVGPEDMSAGDLVLDRGSHGCGGVADRVGHRDVSRDHAVARVHFEDHLLFDGTADGGGRGEDRECRAVGDCATGGTDQEHARIESPARHGLGAGTGQDGAVRPKRIGIGLVGGVRDLAAPRRVRCRVGDVVARNRSAGVGVQAKQQVLRFGNRIDRVREEAAGFRVATARRAVAHDEEHASVGARDVEGVATEGHAVDHDAAICIGGLEGPGAVVIDGRLGVDDERCQRIGADAHRVRVAWIELHEGAIGRGRVVIAETARHGVHAAVVAHGHVEIAQFAGGAGLAQELVGDIRAGDERGHLARERVDGEQIVGCIEEQHDVGQRIGRGADVEFDGRGAGEDLLGRVGGGRTRAADAVVGDAGHGVDGLEPYLRIRGVHLESGVENRGQHGAGGDRDVVSAAAGAADGRRR